MFNGKDESDSEKSLDRLADKEAELRRLLEEIHQRSGEWELQRQKADEVTARLTELEQKMTNLSEKATQSEEQTMQKTARTRDELEQVTQQIQELQGHTGKINHIVASIERFETKLNASANALKLSVPRLNPPSRHSRKSSRAPNKYPRFTAS